MSQASGGESESETQRRVEDKMREVAVLEKRKVFVNEGGECREPAAQSYGQEHAQVGIHQVAALENSVQQADRQATQYVDRQCSERERRSGFPLHPAREQEPGDPAYETAYADEKKRLQHKAAILGTERYGCLLVTVIADLQSGSVFRRYHQLARKGLRFKADTIAEFRRKDTYY